MLPREQRDLFHNGWYTDLWCRGMSPDPLDDCWKWDPLLPEIPEQEFIRNTEFLTSSRTTIQMKRIAAFRPCHDFGIVCRTAA